MGSKSTLWQIVSNQLAIFLDALPQGRIEGFSSAALLQAIIFHEAVSLKSSLYHRNVSTESFSLLRQRLPTFQSRPQADLHPEHARYNHAASHSLSNTDAISPIFRFAEYTRKILETKSIEETFKKILQSSSDNPKAQAFGSGVFHSTINRYNEHYDFHIYATDLY